MSPNIHWQSDTEGWFYDTVSDEIQPFYFYQAGEQVQFWIKGNVFSVAVVTPQAKRNTHKSTSLDSNQVIAPMPGTILKVLVKAGDAVKAGEPVILMESMKMEMTLTAPLTGSVQAVFCSEGQLVEMKSVLIDFKKP